MWRLDGHTSFVMAVCFSIAGYTIASCSADKREGGIVVYCRQTLRNGGCEKRTKNVWRTPGRMPWTLEGLKG